MKTEPNSSAFARIGDEYVPEQWGMTKREYFAAIAMQGLLTRVPKRHNNEVDLGILECERIAAESVIMADKFIEALNKEK